MRDFSLSLVLKFQVNFKLHHHRRYHHRYHAPLLSFPFWILSTINWRRYSQAGQEELHVDKKELHADQEKLQAKNDDYNALHYQCNFFGGVCAITWHIICVLMDCTCL